MNKIILIFLLFFVETVNSQVSFYVSPVVNVKGHYRSNSGKHFYGKLSYSNEYFDFESRRMIFSSLGLGVKAGVNLKNRWLLEFGWTQDETRSGNRVYTTSFSSYTYNDGFNSYTPNMGGSGYMGVQTNRLFFSTHYQLIDVERFKKNKLWFIPYVNLGLGININTFKDPQYLYMHFAGNYGLIDDNVAIKIDYYLNVGNRINVHGQIGFSTDLMFKKQYLFSFSVYSTFSGGSRKRSNDLSSTYTAVFVDTGTEMKKYNFTEGSRGTGLYFELSRRFQLYPWIKIKKKEGRELEKF